MQNIKLNILIAEDYKELADQYKTALEARGHNVIITSNGIECMRVYRQNINNPNTSIKQCFDLVILDQKMPGMDGIDVAREIQQINIKQRIIFITGHGNEVIAKLKELNQNIIVIGKPFTLNALITEVEGWHVSMLRKKLKQGFKEWDGFEGTSVPVGPSRTG